MTTFERIQELAKKKDKNLKEISLELGYSKNYLYTLKTKEPAADKLRVLADYFNVSVDYLLGREEKSKYTSEDLDEMIDNAMFYDGKPLSDNDREIVKAFLEGKFGSK
ncbi:hypothetical protein DFR54_102359 [Vagococcus fluvialis]|uniref:Transcriptional regulator n=1 Tax=Vagococcus fluvialis TaxID=2738 RepID=A0A369B483_9ENTE|nr:helix-turn-helix transcriptional regulator [Vagococcus fluvialis]RCX15296.1 hypothetical protein DFR54_102359 [Vagococcus fluvialis]RSU05434.1 transcriptional regulator [Vagococcus fluvialis]UDM74950.1 helix-turn-helix domain-containing protein [Vagococcus fluvialis]